MSENKSLFREKSMEQFSSPEQLNDYIKITNPSLILILVAIIALLAGTIVWGMLGTIDAEAKVTARVDNRKVSAYLSSADATQLNATSVILISGNHYPVTGVSDPMKASDGLSESDLELFHLKPMDIIVAVSSECDLTDGVYSATVVMQQLKPMDLILK
ncbi:MAG: hypothetical protein IKE16_07610 [Solobacterium sp.]|nr:hypothetical protein [Solobacterium sp.]